MLRSAPQKIAPPKIVAPRPPELQTSSKPKVMFVDDEERILNAMRALFRLKYDVVTTTDGYEALALLKQHHFELIVSDQRMPIMKGVDLLRQAKLVSPNTVRILLTGFSDLADLMGSINDGEIFRFVSKPWVNDELSQIVADGVNVGIALSAEAFHSRSQEVPKYVEPTAKDKDNIIIINGDPAMYQLVTGLLPTCKVFPARNHKEALALMTQHEVAIVVSSMDGDHRADTAFFSLLKREHPQITSIIIAPSGDSEALISLINHARVFRYMFKPLKTGLLNVYLHSALREYMKFKTSPQLLKQQQPAEPRVSLHVSPAIVAMLKGLKSFFKKS
ncbi:MAG: response regulator [Gallionella sp.]